MRLSPSFNLLPGRGPYPMPSKKTLHNRIRELEDELQKTGHQAYFAEQVCYWVGQVLDPANKFLLAHRQEQLVKTYALWKKEVPQVPWRGVFFTLRKCDLGELQIEWLDTEGFWHQLGEETNA